MTSALVAPPERPATLFDRPADGPESALTAVPARDRSGEPTLEQAVVAAWAALADGRTACCPCCHGRLAPRPAASGAVVGGRCRDCGAQLG